MRCPPPGLNRRALLVGVGGAAATGALGAGVAARAAGAAPGPVTLTAAVRQLQLAGASGPSTLWTYGDDVQPVILHARQNQELAIRLENRLPEHTTIHWHGLRVPNAMDGVAFVTQPPVQPGENFLYRFTPPDTGTFFFHPHCDTAQQLGRGLVGVMLVEGDADPRFDADIVLAYRDWMLQADGTLGPFLTSEGAARAGTFGSLATVNGAPDPLVEVPVGADLRLRFLNLDSTRIVDLAVRGAAAAVIATDGNALEPFALDEWRLGPAMRLDLVLRSPDAGGEVEIMNNRVARPVRLARLRAVGPALRRSTFAPPRLPPPALPEPDLAAAIPMAVTLSTGSVAPVPADIALGKGRVLRFADALCLSPQTLWAINRQTWPEAGHAARPAPLAMLAHGRSYIVELHNSSKVIHPMHLHGHTFKVLDSTMGELRPHWADTTLVHPRERRRIAFVADNPGDWMFHCHVIEHQETGMMAILRVA